MRIALLLALLTALALAGCGDTASEPGSGQDSGAAVKDGPSDDTPATTEDETDEDGDAEPEKPRPRRGTALAALDKLTVKGRASKTGYDREQFAGDWASIDGCDMRRRILQRDLRRIIYGAGSDGDVSSGSWPIATPLSGSSSTAAARARSTSTTSSRSETLGRRARSSGATSAARSSPTTR
jgi:hypothetical protein